MDFDIDPKETALLIIDAQNAFCHPEGTLGISGADMAALTAVVWPIHRLVQLCKAHGIPDIWSIQHHLPEDVTRAQHKIQPHTSKRARVACLPGSWDAEIVDELKPLIDGHSHLIEKHKFSVFYGTRLEVLLRLLGRRMLLVCGTTTNACVDTTVREAYMRDYDVVIVRDAVGGVNPAWHEMALAVWARYVGAVVSLQDIERALADASPASILSQA
jgi:ureidoacrylate peracid hydrolase